MKFKVDKTVVASVVLHIFVIGWAMISFSSRALEVPPDSVAVDTISATDFTRMTAGVQTAAKDNPKPKVDKVAEVVTPPEDSSGKITTKKELITTNAAQPPPPPKPVEKPVEKKPDPPKPVQRAKSWFSWPSTRW